MGSICWGHAMNRAHKVRFSIDTAFASLALGLLLLTLVFPDWIELFFGVDPDGGNGSVEWAIVGVLALTTIVFAALARAEWRRAAAHEMQS